MLAIEPVHPPDLCFEDFIEGQEFATVTKGPIMVGHQVRRAGACDNSDSVDDAAREESRDERQLHHR
jgi:hypothetical protein